MSKKIKLYPHNEDTYARLTKMFAGSRRVCAVQPTGTGKTFLGLRLIEDNPGKRIVILSPEVAIFAEFIKNAESSNASEILENTEFLTYQALACMDYFERSMLNPHIIILDEFHRVGAEVWGAAALELLELNPEAFVFGLTATPIRYLDSGRNMGEEVFHGQYACYMTAGEAVGMGILPNPIFVSGIYENDGLIERFRRDNQSRDNKRRKKAQELLDQLELMRRNLQYSHGVAAIFKKYMFHDHGKFIVFCRDVQHLKELKEKFPSWIKDINEKYRFYVSISERPDCDEQLEAFRNDEGENAIRLMFCVDRLNEGVHVKVDGVMMFRPTVSPIIYLQQIGRALVSGGKNPLIFDFVNNRLSIIRMMGEDPFEEGIKRGGGGIRYNEDVPEFHFEGQQEDYLAIIRDLCDVLYPDREDLWQEKLETAKAFRATHNRWPSPNDGPLGAWCNKQRQAKKNGTLSPEREKQLLDAGFIFDPFEAKWQEQFAETVVFHAAHNRWPCMNDGPLGAWCNKQRQAKKNGTLSPEREKQLLDAGFIFDPLEVQWQEYFAGSLSFRNIHNRWPSPNDGPLGDWCNNQRHTKKKGKLSPEREKQLLDAGFIFDPFEVQWQEYFAGSLSFHAAHNRWPGKNDGSLGNWCNSQRRAKKNGTLSPEREKQLLDAGFIFDPLEVQWQEYFAGSLSFRDIHNRWPGQSDGPLGRWCHNQRQAKKNGTLDSEREKQLLDAGFIFDQLEAQWQESFAETVAFHTTHNRWPGKSDGPLGRWCRSQRQAKRTGILKPHREALLQGVGFFATPK